MPECKTCGSAVSDKFARVFGNNANEVRVCIECTSAEDISGRKAAHPDQ